MLENIHNFKITAISVELLRYPECHYGQLVVLCSYLRDLFSAPFQVALGAGSRVCYLGNAADRQTQ
jgi:hypothetical protein